MIERINPFKALSFFIVLVLIAGNLSYTGVAADTPVAPGLALTHVGQPVKNLVTLKYNLKKNLFYRLDPNMQNTDENTAFTVPVGYSLIITDISYFVGGLGMQPYNKVQLNAENTNGSQQILYYRSICANVSYGLDYSGFEICDHLTTGIVVASGCKIKPEDSTYLAYLYQYGYYDKTVVVLLSGYLVGSSAAQVQAPAQGQTSAQPQALAQDTAPASPVKPSAGQQEISSAPSYTSPSVESPSNPWIGRWLTSCEDLGVMELSFNGNSFIGTIGNGKYIVSGTVSGKELTAVWQEPETKFNGNLKLTLSDDGKSFSGKWNSSLSPTWQNISGNRQ